MAKATLVAVETLTPYVNNSRRHPESQIDQLAAAIDKFGLAVPIVIRDGTIAKGHGCVEAIKKLYDQGHAIYPPPGKANGAKAFPDGKVPMVDATGWSEDDFRAFVILDNKLSENSQWDEELLKVELSDLRLNDYDLDILGFDPKELNTIFSDPNTGDTDEDETPEPEERAKSKTGDVWILGNHRLVCGDSTDPDTVKSCLGKVKPHLMVTDPPYGVDYDPEWRLRAGVSKNEAKMGKVENDGRADWQEAWSLFPGSVVYVWHGGLHSSVVAESLVGCDFEIRSQIIWAKERFALSRGNYHWQHEPCWYAVKKGTKASWAGDRSQSTIWNINAREDSGHGHGTQKPVECMRRPIVNNSSPGQAVYEPFSGSGTTIIACETTGRACHAIELNPIYVDMAIKRWQDFTGETAIHEESGKTFNKTRYRKA